MTFLHDSVSCVLSIADIEVIQGFHRLVESIMQWRMAPTSQNRAKIPHPFTPTILQQRFADHHPAIDFLTWGELRDQLLLYVNLNGVDLNKLLYDSVRCVVREFPELQVAVPVLDAVAYIATTHASASAKTTPTTGTNEIYGPGYGLKDDGLRRAVVDRIKSHGFDRFEERKISPAFGVAYPFLDISNSKSLVRLTVEFAEMSSNSCHHAARSGL
jgi:hypothetical protein